MTKRKKPSGIDWKSLQCARCGGAPKRVGSFIYCPRCPREVGANDPSDTRPMDRAGRHEVKLSDEEAS